MITFNQIKQLIEASENILISLPQEVDGDNFCGALALFYTLKKLGKKVNLISPHFPEKLKFLINEEVLENQNSLLISMKMKGGKIDKIRYEKDSQELKFYLNLKNGEIEIENISFKTSEEMPDLIITLEEGGLVFNPTLAAKEKLILYKSSSLSVCQTINNFLESFEENLIQGKIATCLLAGLIVFTQNFQNSKVNPEILKEVSWLIKRGADYQSVIKYFYKTRSLSEVKLLSQTLAKLNFDKEKGVAWCSLSQEDFKNSGSSSRELSFVLEALKLNFSLPETVFVLWQDHRSQPIIKGVFYSTKEDLVKRILENFEGVAKGNCAIFLIRDNDLRRPEEKILNLLG